MWEFQAAPGFEALGGEHLGDALAQPGLDVVVLCFHDGNDRGLHDELQWRQAEQIIADTAQPDLGVYRKVYARKEADAAPAEPPHFGQHGGDDELRTGFLGADIQHERHGGGQGLAQERARCDRRGLREDIYL